MITVHDVEQGTEAWHELRRLYPFTGSGAHKVLRFGTIDYAKAEQSSFGGNFYTRRGHELEDECLELYGEIYDTRVQRPGFITNDAYRGCGYSPDGIDAILVTGETMVGRTTLDRNATLLECKAFKKERHLAIAKGSIPFEILAQIHYGMFITELRKAKLILYNPDLAKEELNGEPNPDYDPSMALVIIDIKYNRNIQANFRRIIKGTK